MNKQIHPRQHATYSKKIYIGKNTINKLKKHVYVCFYKVGVSEKQFMKSHLELTI